MSCVMNETSSFSPVLFIMMTLARTVLFTQKASSNTNGAPSKDHRWAVRQTS
jgi:hypothetical protein